MSRESFLVYKSFYEPIRQLSDEDFGKIFKAVFEYQLEGKKPEISPLLMMAFSFIKDALDRDNLKYQMIVERNSNNGKNGGRPKKEPKKPSRLSGNRKNPKNPSEADNDTVTDNDTVNVNKNENKFNFKQSLIDLGVSDKIISDWLAVRKGKGSVNTETALETIKKQIELSGLTANECIKISAENSWAGFKAEWAKNLNSNNIQNNKKQLSSQVDLSQMNYTEKP